MSMQFCTLDQKISYLLQFIKLEELLFSMAVATLNRSRTLLLDGSTVVFDLVSQICISSMFLRAFNNWPTAVEPRRETVLCQVLWDNSNF